MPPARALIARAGLGRFRPSPALVLAVAGIAGLFAGCSALERDFSSTTLYEPPLERRVVVETVVALPFDETWDELIRRLSESKFRIATLEKASRFVDVQLELSSDAIATANRPARYVDCGRTARTLTGGGLDGNWVYEVAASSHHRESAKSDEGFRVSHVERLVSLEAQASLYLQPEGPDRTRVSVNARYALTIEIEGEARFHPIERAKSISDVRSFGPRTESIRFTSFREGRDKRSAGLVCRVTGEFEHALIALANPGAAL